MYQMLACLHLGLSAAIDSLLRSNINFAIIILCLLVGLYQPIGPDLLIIMRGLSGYETYSSALIAICFTMLGAGLAYFVARIWGRRCLLGLLKRRARAIEKATILYRRYGSWFVFISAIGPIPLTYAIWVSGLLGMPARRFFPLVAIGLVPRFLAEAILVSLFPDLARWLTERFRVLGVWSVT